MSHPSAIKPVLPWRTRLYNWSTRDSSQGYFMAGPAFIYLALLLGYPLLLAVWLSMTNKMVGQPGDFVGLTNFTRQWQSQIFVKAFTNTFIYTFASTFFKLILGFGLGLLLNQRFIGRNFVRTILLLPWIVPPALSTMAWRWMFDPNLSALNWVMRTAGISQKGIPWLIDPTWALISVIIVNVWRGVPFFGITTLAGLQTISPELYDAAAIDGANAWQQLRRITIPLVTPIVIVVLIVTLIGTFSDLQIVFGLTGGGPVNATQVLALFSYKTGLQSGQLGQGAAVSLYMLPVLLLLVILEVQNMKRAAQ